MKEFFSVVISCEEMEAPKPDPKGLIEACGKLYRGIDNLIYVGDSPTDIQTCKNMSAFSVAVLFDEARQQQLLDKKPCAVIHEFPQLLELLKEDSSGVISPYYKTICTQIYFGCISLLEYDKLNM